MNNQEIECSKILDGLNQLSIYLEQSIAKDALDLDTNALTVRSKELLERLKRSLIQYTERGKNLAYIGFMGHFSTGKSSTINSLLALDSGSRERRSIGLNPVDKVITLITHKKNESLVFNVTKEGLVPIRSSFIENSFLENIVIADTPGTGDPVLTGEIARDFLPICDLIIYFFSATNPLDTADQPLLAEKFSSLHFIPIKFVVTRADEFRCDSESSLDADNFDVPKANAFLGAFTQRINQLFQVHNINISSEDILLLDNKAKFNVQELQEFLLGFSDASNVANQVRIHAHKVLYFRNTAKTLGAFFLDFLTEKTLALSKFVDVAYNNIERFNDHIHISNNSLTESWTNSYRDIRSNLVLFNSLLPNTLKLPESQTEFSYEDRANKLSTLKRDIRQASRKGIDGYIENRRKSIYVILRKKLLICGGSSIQAA